MGGKGSGKRLTDSERMEIIARLEDKTKPLSRAKCARLYGVTPAAISKLMKVSQTVKKRYSDAGAESGHLRDKRQRGGFSKNMCFEDELYKWICSIRARKIPLLVAHVQQKAKLLAAKHHMNEDFKASNGWYYRFCARYGLAPASLHAGGGAASSISSGINGMEMHRTGEELTSEDRESKYRSSDDPETSEHVKVLREKVKEYGAEFVYTVSEARLFYQLLPSTLRPPTLMAGGNQEERTAGIGSDGKPTEPRVLLLVCANGSGTHKIPLLVIGKEKSPQCFTAHPTKLLGGNSTRYVSQREVWCDNQTFQYWCQEVFLPAIRQRTTRPVLLLAENPGGHLVKFEQENVSTLFLPMRPNHNNTLASNSDGHGNSLTVANPAGAFEPMQHGVIRELKRRYKVSLFQEMLTFLEKGEEETYVLVQRALKKPHGTAGVAFGRLPHLLDAMELLREVWGMISPQLIRECWTKTNLCPDDALSSMTDIIQPATPYVEISDDVVVLELCSMLRNVTIVNDLSMLAKELRLWLYADDDSSERMQQELLHDIQLLLQEEEHEGKGDSSSTVPQQEQSQQQQSLQQQSQAMSTSPVDPTQLQMPGDDGFASLAMGNVNIGAAALYRSDLVMDANLTTLREKRKIINMALHALANAEEALDEHIVVEHFGEQVTAEAREQLALVLRNLRRIHRGKQSSLATDARSSAETMTAAAPAGTVAAMNGSDMLAPTNTSIQAAHEYFYGSTTTHQF